MHVSTHVLQRPLSFSIDPQGTHDCCWIDTANSELGDMRMFTRIDLTPRPDTGLLNRSPVTDMVPLVLARTGCRHRLIIPHSDPDVDDVVRCRWAQSNADTFKDECGVVCNALAASPYNAILIEETCEMIWTPPAPGEYAVAVQLEDFAPSSPLDEPLSSVPLQFLIKVTDPVLECDARPYILPQEGMPRVQERCYAVPVGGTFNYELLIGHSAYPQRK